MAVHGRRRCGLVAVLAATTATLAAAAPTAVRGLTTACHDGTNTLYVDNTSTGPTTWGCCLPQGFSTGLNYRF